jgi:glyoxylase-like metal-dependent hydrolase (beta-lactamase superfamily II)
MIKIHTLVFNAFQVNTYILSDETGESIVIDAACYSQNEKDVFDQFIANNQLKPVKALNTHCHVDHVLGNKHVAEKYHIPLEVNQNDLSLLATADKHGIVFGFHVEEQPVIKEYLAEDKDITFGNSSLKVFHVPGHSPGSVAFYSPEGKFVIVGDVLFKGSIGRTDLPGGNYDQLIDSIYKKLMTLPPDTVVFPGHGPSTTIHEEALSNPFLS